MSSAAPKASDSRKRTQRERIVSGMIAAANRDGYAGANVSAVIANAGVSRPTFYEYFVDRDDCFLAAHRDLAAYLLERVREAVTAGPPEQAVQIGVRVLIELAEALPEQARFLANETMAGGPRTLDERDRTVTQLARIIDRARAKAPADAPTPDLPTRALIGAVQWLLAPRLRRGEHDLTELQRDTIEWIESYALPSSSHRWRALTPGPELPQSPHTSELSLHPPPPIPPGRTSLSPGEIARNHRERVLYATAEVAVQKGYPATTVADITATAGVDRRVFYTHFRDKQQAFLAVHELMVQQTMAIAAGAFFSGATWPERIWEGVRATAQFEATYPILAHVGFVESHAVGAPAVQRVDDSRAAFTIFLQEGYQNTDRPPSRLALEAITAAVMEIGYTQARSRRGNQMPRLACHAVYVVLAPFLGPRRANEVIDGKLAELRAAGARAPRPETR
jgi:AcrR family transcriptional regulator